MCFLPCLSSVIRRSGPYIYCFVETMEVFPQSGLLMAFLARCCARSRSTLSLSRPLLARLQFTLHFDNTPSYCGLLISYNALLSIQRVVEALPPSISMLCPLPDSRKQRLVFEALRTPVLCTDLSWAFRRTIKQVVFSLFTLPRPKPANLSNVLSPRLLTSRLVIEGSIA